jgi:propanol-preferring alcohol dehydrogenase
MSDIDPHDSMRAMVFDGARRPLRDARIAKPEPDPDQVLVRVHVCGVCRTDLHILDGELPRPKLRLVLGHQIVGTVVGRVAWLDRR